MTRYILTTIISIAFVFSANAQSKWSIGINSGPSTNISQFDSGDETANAMFSNNMFQAGHISAIVKYNISERKAFQTGITVSQFGFSYGMSKAYSLKKPFERNEEIKTEIGMISIPAMMLIHTRKNCNNIRFVFGAGATVRLAENVNNEIASAEVNSNQNGNARSTVITSETNTVSNVSASLTWKIGVEKVLRNGGSFTFTYLGNQGLNTIAESSVSYTADAQSYNHSFINRGSYVNFALGYQFAPFGTRKALKESIK